MGGPHKRTSYLIKLITKFFKVLLVYDNGDSACEQSVEMSLLLACQYFVLSQTQIYKRNNLSGTAKSIP